jgi:hypothetical protein
MKKFASTIEGLVDGRIAPKNMERLLDDLHVVNAKNTLQHGKQNPHLATVADFVGHANTIWKLDETEDWKLQLRAALTILNAEQTCRGAIV